MLYKIVKRFGPRDGDRWLSYLGWRGLDLTGFDSVDGILRPDFFEPRSEEDWYNCVNEDHKLNLITNLDYSKKILTRYKNPALVGVEINLKEGYVPKEELLGFDIVDGYCDVSLITNWRTGEDDLINNHVQPNGLIGDLNRALKICNLLRKEFLEDSHANNCEVWAIYKVDF